jgi:hypothetical protein
MMRGLRILCTLQLMELELSPAHKEAVGNASGAGAAAAGECAAWPSYTTWLHACPHRGQIHVLWERSYIVWLHCLAGASSSKSSRSSPDDKLA